MDNKNNDYKNVDAEVLGELRKEKIGQPIIAVVILVMLAGVIVALPYINTWINDEEGIIYKTFHKGEVDLVPVGNDKEKMLDAKELQILSYSTQMMYDNLIIMKNFTITENSIKCVISSYNNLINLDEKEYYLELYSSNMEPVKYVKLSGTYDNSETNVELKNNFNFNNNRTYYGKIVLMSDKDYPIFNLSSDESGIESIKCSNSEETLEYTFQNGYLIGIQDVVNIKFNNNDAYQNKLALYKEKANNLGSIADVSENSTGFMFNAKMDLNTYRVPSSVVDYNYFKASSEVKVVKYNIEGKGFECK